MSFASPENAGKEGPQLARMGASQGFPRAAASVGLFSRGRTRFSGSLSCGAREVMARAISFATTVDAVMRSNTSVPPVVPALTWLTVASPRWHLLHWGRLNGMTGQCQGGQKPGLDSEGHPSHRTSAEIVSKFSFSAQSFSPHSLKGGVAWITPQ